MTFVQVVRGQQNPAVSLVQIHTVEVYTFYLVAVQQDMKAAQGSDFRWQSEENRPDGVRGWGGAEQEMSGSRFPGTSGGSLTRQWKPIKQIYRKQACIMYKPLAWNSHYSGEDGANGATYIGGPFKVIRLIQDITFSSLFTLQPFRGLLWC